MQQPGWTAIVVNYNGASYLAPCLMALERTIVPPTTTLVVDNASTDDSLLELHAFPRVEALPQVSNLGFAGGANAGLRATQTEYAVVLNPDVEVDPAFGSSLMSAFERHPRLGAAGTLLTYPTDGRVQHAGGIVDRPLLTTRHRGYGADDPEAFRDEKDVDFVTGGAMGLRMSALSDSGLFDEQFSPVYYEDVDLCYRLRSAGWRVMLIPGLTAEHHEGVTLKRELAYFRHLHRNRIRFALKHLAHKEWANEFVPAELARLRHELMTAQGPDVQQSSGAASIESVLRGIDGAASWNEPGLLCSWTSSDASIERARQFSDVTGRPLESRVPLLGWLRNALNNFGPRWYVDPALEQQRQFNAAILETLASHERLHREQMAALLLIALDAIGRLNQLGEPQTDGPRTVSTLEW